MGADELKLGAFSSNPGFELGFDFIKLYYLSATSRGAVVY